MAALFSNNNPLPNIILINADDLGYGDLGCYGSKINHSPNLDRMASEGMRFTDFCMASSLCSPSRGAMMTGCYPPRIGFGAFEGRSVLFPGQAVGLNPNETTLAKILKGQGYATKLVGKWHCGDQPEFLPTRHGFDSFYGLPYSNDMGRKPKKPDNPPLPLMRNEEVVEQQPDQASLTERYAEEAVRFIREKKNQPFFLYFAHMHVHVPHYVPSRFLSASANGVYGAAVEVIDWSAALVLHELKEQGLDENTLVIFTSDNGSDLQFNGCNAPLRGKKGTTWEGGFRVPCIMRWPGRIFPGRVCSELITGMDFYPTLARFAGAEIPAGRIIDGKDIGSLIKGEQGAVSPHPAFFYYLRNRLQAARYGKWKLQHYHSWSDQEPVNELYDLKSDIGETCNLYGQYPEIVKQLEEYMQACREDIGDSAANIPGRNCRMPGSVKDPKPLTKYNPDHPYMVAMYDLAV